MEPIQGQGGESAPSGPPVTIDAVVELLRNERLRGYRIDIETDQMVEADENAEKQRRTEFVTAVGMMVKEAAVLVANPIGAAMLPAIGQTLMFAVRGFKAGREVEETFEKAIEGIQTSVQQQQQQGQQPDPAEMAKQETERLKQQGIAQKQAGEERLRQMEERIKLLEHQLKEREMVMDAGRMQREEQHALTMDHINAQAAARQAAMPARQQQGNV